MENIENLISRLRSEDPKIRIQAAKDLGAMGDKAAQASGLLASALDDIWIQKSAFWALCQMTSALSYCVVELGEKLKSEDEFAREAAAQLIGYCGKDAMPYMDTLKNLAKNDSSLSIREKAKESFFKIDPDALLD